MEFIYPGTDEEVDEIQAVLASDRGQGIVDVRGNVQLHYVIVKENAATIAIASIDWRIGELSKLYVAPPHRGRGIGTALVNRVIELLQDDSYDELLIETTEESFQFWGKFISSRTFIQTDFNKVAIAL